MLSVDNTVHRQHTQAQSSYFLLPFFLTCRRASTCGLREGCCCWRADSTCHRLWHPDREVLCVLEGIYRGDQAALKREKRKMKRLEYGWGGEHSNGKCNNKNLAGGGWKICAPKLCVSDGQCSSGWNSWFSNATVFTFHCSFPVVSSWKKPNTNRYK